ncbi:serine/threonine-protein kinase [Archangium sp.]|jgi:serine/threonine-protein kinase|uniref:serine/threonine-protein kinase n=1 Tax=Archangium sp. TaxID=1872627 RepID=UPI002ED9ED7A
MEPFSDERTVRRAPSTAPVEQVSPESPEEDEPAWESTVRKDVMVGQKLGEYVVRRRIGSGGMGVVYEGEHPVIGRKVAIKIIRPDSSEGVRSRDLIDEARAASAIRHRGIIDIFGFGTLPGVGQYLVMEFLNGRPLDEVILDRAPMHAAEGIRLIIEVLGALAAAHAEGVIHRDLKPGNIFVVLESNGSEYVKVLDFGLAKRGAAPNSATPQTRASMIVGTPEYMAPEQACGQAVSPRTDLYAVGIIMFEMLTGRLPFRGDSAMQTAIMQVQTPPPSPSKFVDGLPPALDDLILRLLAKEPDQRPASADLVARELKGIARMLAVDMTQLSGFARAVPESAASAPRPQLRQEPTGAAPPRGGPGARPAAAPPAQETVTAPRGGTDARPALAPPPANLAAARGGVASRPAAPARSQQGARPQAPRPQPQAPAPHSPPTTEVGLRNEALRGSRSGLKLLASVGLAAILLGAGAGVVWMRRGDSAPTVPTAPTPTSKPKPEPKGVTGSQPAVAPQPEPKLPVAEPAPAVAQTSDQTEAPPPDEASPPRKTGSPPVSQEKDATSGPKLRSPMMGNGTLKVVSECYTEVYVENALKGGVPGSGALVSLPPGKYLVRLEGKLILNPEKTITIRPGATSKYEARCSPD